MSAEIFPAPRDVPDPVHLSGVRVFGRWWRDELIGLLPRALREPLRAGAAIPVVFSQGAWRLHDASRATLEKAGEPTPPDSRPLASIAHNMNLCILLGPAEAVVRDATLPLAAEEEIDAALEFELDRLTPLPAERAFFGYVVTGRDEAEKVLKLRFAVAPRERVDRYVSELRAVGARVLGVSLVEEYSGEVRALNLLPIDQRDRPALGRQVIATRGLTLVAAVLAAATLIYPVWLKRESVIGLLPRVEKARQGADVSVRLAAEIEALAKEHNFLLAKKHAQTPMAQLVEELTKQLPDNTWVQQLDVKPAAKSREVQIAGETGSSSALVEVLERSGLFANATFKSPLTKGASPNTERYLLAAELKSREPPPPIAEEALVKPAPQ